MPLLTGKTGEFSMTRFRYWLTMFAAMGLPAVFGCTYAADKLTVQTLDANGVKIAYSVQGKGDPVVLIHGWLSSAGINWALPGVSTLLARTTR